MSYGFASGRLKDLGDGVYANEFADHFGGQQNHQNSGSQDECGNRYEGPRTEVLLPALRAFRRNDGRTSVAILWLIDGNRPTSWDLIGAAVAIVGMAIIMLGPQAV
jgi:Uncharacterised BCR, YnfA/UPF0060 family